MLLRRCGGCSKKRSLRTNTFFAEFSKVSLSTLILAIFYFTQDDPQQRITRALGINASLVSKIVTRLQDVCSIDIMSRPFIPFGGPGTVVKRDESKFNHKAKVKLTRWSLFIHYFLMCFYRQPRSQANSLRFLVGPPQSEGNQRGGSTGSLANHTEFVNCCSTTEGERLPVTHGYSE